MSSIRRTARPDPVMAGAVGKPARSARTKLALTVQYAVVDNALPTRSQFRAWAKAALQHDAVLTLRLVDAEEGQWLNHKYRGQDHSTNVLSFVYPDTEPLSGDIALCVPVIAREARQQNKTLEAHYAHLVVHGVLHLQDYDHEKVTDARVMEALEGEIVTKLGYADPYKTQ